MGAQYTGPDRAGVAAGGWGEGEDVRRRGQKKQREAGREGGRGRGNQRSREEAVEKKGRTRLVNR